MQESYITEPKQFRGPTMVWIVTLIIAFEQPSAAGKANLECLADCG